MSEISLKYPEWGSAYVVAILETDAARLIDKADEAEVAILHRLQSLDGRITHEELEAIQNAIRGLRNLRRERGLSPSNVTLSLLLWQAHHSKIDQDATDRGLPVCD